MKKLAILSAGVALLLYAVPAIAAPASKATGGLTLGSPNQQISFNAFDYGASNLDKGKVEYQNFDAGLHYNANVLCANVPVPGNDAWFMWQVPSDAPVAAGYYVVAHVEDNGSPGTNGDKYGHAATLVSQTALSWCEKGTAPVTDYSITGGNLVVHN